MTHCADRRDCIMVELHTPRHNLDLLLGLLPYNLIQGGGKVQQQKKKRGWIEQLRFPVLSFFSPNLKRCQPWYSIHLKSMERKFCIALPQAAKLFHMLWTSFAVWNPITVSLIFYIPPPSLPPLDGRDPVCIFRLGRGVFKVCSSLLAVLNQLFSHIHQSQPPISYNVLSSISGTPRTRAILSLFQRMREGCLWVHRTTPPAFRTCTVKGKPLIVKMHIQTEAPNVHHIFQYLPLFLGCHLSFALILLYFCYRLVFFAFRFPPIYLWNSPFKGFQFSYSSDIFVGGWWW